MPGPAPKPDAQRRRRNAPMANTLRLPSEGRTGPTPRWPRMGRPPAVWAELWRTPQAVAWERLGWTRVVARYCSALAVAEKSMSPAMLAEVRQLEDRLGLTPMAMLRLRWEVAADEVAEARDERPAAAPRRRLKVVGGDAVDS